MFDESKNKALVEAIAEKSREIESNTKHGDVSKVKVQYGRTMAEVGVLSIIVLFDNKVTVLKTYNIDEKDNCTEAFLEIANDQFRTETPFATVDSVLEYQCSEEYLDKCHLAKVYMLESSIYIDA